MSELIWDFKSSDESGGIIDKRYGRFRSRARIHSGISFRSAILKTGKGYSAMTMEKINLLINITEIKNTLTILRIYGL